MSVVHEPLSEWINGHGQLWMPQPESRRYIFYVDLTWKVASKGPNLCPLPTRLYQVTKSLSKKPGKALLVRSGYPKAPTGTSFGDFRVGFSSIVFTRVHWFIYQKMNVGQILSHPQMSYYSSILPLVLVNGTPRALIAKTKSNQS